MLTSFGLLSQPKYVIPATAGDKLVFGGGYLNIGGSWEPTNTVDIYNLAANTWSHAQLSITRGAITVAAAGNKILYAGGDFNGIPSARVDIYDAAANSWSTANLSMARSGMTTAVAGNKAFFAGWDYFGFTNRVDIYDASTNLWSTTALSEARNGMSAIAAGNKVFFAGGYREYQGFDDLPFDFSTRVDIYDIATNTWSTAELKEARSGMTTATAGNKVLFAGGYHVTNSASAEPVISNKVDVYDVSTNSWSTTSLDEARSGTVAATVGNKVLFAGGESSKVYIYDALLNSWSQAMLSQPRNVSSTATLGSKVLFFTGSPNNNRIDIYDAAANTWSTADLDKSLHSFPIVAANKVFIGGGQINTVGSYANSHSTRNVWKLEF
jgi:kelch-like protein 20